MGSDPRSAPIRAAIDVGTNSVLLLVAAVRSEGGGKRLEVLDEAEQVTRLGEGVAASAELRPEAIRRTVAVIRSFVERARARGAEEIQIVATNAARSARNAKDFVKAVETEVGVPVRILSGQEEAYAAFRGAQASLGHFEGTILVIDVGGGSTELVAGDNQPRGWVSLEIGAVRLSERFVKSDPWGPEEWRELREAVRRSLANVELSLSDRPAVTVGVGGTITTLGMVKLGLDVYDARALEGLVFAAQELDSWAEKLARMTVAERRRLPGVPALRADVLPAGVAIFAEAVRRFDSEHLRVSTFGIRHGILLG